MHYHVKVGLPAGSFRDIKDWDELQERIFAEVNLVMRKYDDSGEIDEYEMEEFGITPCYYEEDEEKYRYILKVYMIGMNQVVDGEKI